MPDRNYRDAVHDLIRVDLGSDEGRLIVRLIDTREFQRLRRVRQLGLAYFAYPSAEHSRFTHSLGAFHLATRVLDRLGERYEITADDRTAVRVAALVHDVGHGPFSHVIENILGFHHEDFTVEAVLSDATEIGNILREYSPGLASDVADIIKGTFKPMALAQLVSSQLDVDRMDYLLRDSLMTGVKYGIYDLEWVLKSLEINEADDRLYVSAQGIYAVEAYLQARHYMFRQVYFHRTLRAAEVLLQSVIRRAIYLFKSGEPVWCAAGTAFEALLAGRKLTLHEHLSLDDSDFVFHIKQWRNSEDAILSDLAARFMDRRNFKAFDLDMPEDFHASFVASAGQAVADHGFDPDYYFVEDKAGNVPNYFYTGNPSDPKNSIYVEDGFSRPSIKEISEVSAAVSGLQEAYRIHRVCFPGEVQERIEALYHADSLSSAQSHA